jgi:hypothetical protein
MKLGISVAHEQLTSIDLLRLPEGTCGSARAAWKDLLGYPARHLWRPLLRRRYSLIRATVHLALTERPGGARPAKGLRSGKNLTGRLPETSWLVD